MYLLLCRGCGETNTIVCSCPDGHTAAHGVHLDACAMAHIGANVTCNPASGSPLCCQQDHDHDLAAECGTDHSEQPCPHGDPAACPVGGIGKGDDPGTQCPGGHCAKGVPGCNVCRPLLILAIGGVVPTGSGVN